MASPDQLRILYGDLRASLLSRHFALGRYFRTNLLSLFNHLGYLHGSEPNPPPDKDDLNLPCGSVIARPSPYADATALGNLSQPTQLLERWRIAWHERENPLMYSGKLLTCLAVEYALGNAESLEILRQALKSIASLYKFMGNSFDGYIVRWDAVTSDRWSTRASVNGPIPYYCCEFLIGKDPNGQPAYLYCTPLDSPAYDPRIPEEGGDLVRHMLYRGWEPSQDELVGLVMGYDMAFRLVAVNDVRDEIRRQVSNLAAYLAQYGYLLVRPCGGFAARGASGLLPAMEFPFGRVFERITGQPFSATTSFESALQNAGVWDCLKGPLLLFSLGGVGLGAVFGYFLALFAPGALAILVGLLGAGAFVVLARALAIYLYRACFDVSNDGQRSEFALAYVLLKIPPRARYTLWLTATSYFPKGPPPWSLGFPPYIGLTALDDSDTTVRDAYLNWHNSRRSKQLGLEDVEFSTAVAAVLDSGVNEEITLAQHLQTMYGELENSAKHDLELYYNSDDTVIEVADKSAKGEVLDKAGKKPVNLACALEYMTCLALAWLHSKRRQDMGNPVPSNTGLPSNPDFSGPLVLPAISVPAAVIDGAQTGVVPLPQNAVQADGEPSPGQDAGLFGPGSSSKPPDAPPPPPVEADFYTDTVEHYGGTGGRGDDVINAGRLVTGSGCIVQYVQLELLDKDGKVLAVTQLNWPDAVNSSWGSSIGARITSDGTSTNDETVGVHWWYDLGRACRYRLHYFLFGNNCTL